MKSVEEKETQAPAPTPVEEASEQILRLGKREADLLHERQAKADQLRKSEAQAGVEYLDGQSAGTVDLILKLQAELASIGRAMSVCHTRRLEAIKRKFEADTEELRKQLAEKQGQLTVLEERSREFLYKLAELQDVPIYGTEILRVQGDGQGGIYPCRSAALEADILRLQERIFAAERRQVPTSGVIDVDGVIGIEPLLAALAAYEGETPSVEAVLDWAANVERRSGQQFENLQRRTYFVWKAGGEIDCAGSYVQVPALMKTREGVTFGTKLLDVSSGTFK
jgi:hypothetical protein